MESLADLYLHFDARRVVGIKPPHATGARAGIPVPSGGGYSGFSLSDGAAATCSWRYGFAGRPSNGTHGGSAWRGRLFFGEKEHALLFPLDIPDLSHSKHHTHHCATILVNNSKECRKICSGNAVDSARRRNASDISTALAF